jgi:hypothetical protein
MKTLRTKPRRVDFYRNRYDLSTLVLGGMGFSTAYIMSRTDLTKCQVLYRLHKGDCRRTDYREGMSVGAKLVLQWAIGQVREEVVARLSQHRPGGRRE